MSSRCLALSFPELQIMVVSNHCTAVAVSKQIGRSDSLYDLRCSADTARWDSVNSRLRLHRHAAVQWNRVEGACKAILHVLLEINTACRSSAVVISSGSTNVASRGGGETTVAVRRHTRRGAEGVLALRRGHGVLAVCWILVYF